MLLRCASSRGGGKGGGGGREHNSPSLAVSPFARIFLVIESASNRRPKARNSLENIIFYAGYFLDLKTTDARTIDTHYVSLKRHLYTFRNRLLIYMFTRSKRLGVTLIVSAIYSNIPLTLLITYLPFELNYNDCVQM